MKLRTIAVAIMLVASSAGVASGLKQKSSARNASAGVETTIQASKAAPGPEVLAQSDSTPTPSAAEKAIVCVACHGEDGNSTVPTNPILAGQTSRYLYLQLKDFKEGRRKDPLMSPMAATLSKEDMRALADHFAGKKAKSTGFDADAGKATKGKAVADAALCTMCHLGGFSGQNEIPRVAGQHYDYVVKQLKDFRAKHRTNDAGNMTSVSRGLSDDDIDNLAHYISGLN